MINTFAVWSIARYEAKLLFRSWAFRIFSVLGLLILFGTSIGTGSRFTDAPYILRALSGSLPLANIKLLNIYQGIIAAFLATEFFKRDRRHDTTQVIFTRSFTNLDYLIGKLAGIGVVFGALNLSVLVMSLIIHAFFSHTPFAWQPYVYFTAVISLPTLMFTIGVSLLLVTLVRSQAVVFVIMLGYSLLVLIFLGRTGYAVLDAYALYLPVIYSDFIGAGNLGDVVLLRGAYLLAGIALLGGTVVFAGRLKQSRLAAIAAAVASLVAVTAAIGMASTYLVTKYADDAYRADLREVSREYTGVPTVDVIEQDLDLRFTGDKLAATALIRAVNNGGSVLDSVLLTLNPGLAVSTAVFNGQEAAVARREHILWLRPTAPLRPGDTCRMEIAYSGYIDERYCFLDIDDSRFNQLFRIWLFSIPKRYAVVSSDFVHLTAESGWYPVAGLPPGAAFPEAVPWDFSRFRLAVAVPEDLTAVSQGAVTVDSGLSPPRWVFTPETPLPRLSLTIGRYNRRGLEVDGIEYSLHVLPGHQYYDRFFDEITDTLPFLIREIKNEYEVTLGLEYPYARLTLVEVPIHLYAYDRLWTTGHETVQPQVVHLPELGMYCRGTDFDRMKRRGTRQQERANQAEDPKAIQANYFTTFVKADLLEESEFSGRFGGEFDVEASLNILPNHLSYQTHLSSTRWPVLHYALESYFDGRVKPAQTAPWRIWQGLTDQERANLALKEFSLAEVIGHPGLDQSTLKAALRSKGNTLFARLEASAGTDVFSRQLKDFIDSHRYHAITDEQLIAFAAQLGQTDFAEVVKTWYTQRELPGFLVDEVESYKVIDGERTRTQLKCEITNPTAVPGLIKINLRYRRQGSGFGGRMFRMQERYDYARIVSMPAQSRRLLALLLEQPPAEMMVETYVSQNIPSTVTLPFREQTVRANERPLEMDSLVPLTVRGTGAEGEYVIDNEDTGFEIIGLRRENWLRRSLRSLFGATDSADVYVGVRFWDPPGFWLPTTGQHFYGRFVRSAYHKESGDGTSKVSWTADIDRPGNYDVYYYYEGEDQIPRFGPRHQRAPQGEKHFFVSHEDGVEEVVLDLDAAEEGWNFLGTFRLTTGQSRIELTDKSTANMVIADAVKWVRR